MFIFIALCKAVLVFIAVCLVAVTALANRYCMIITLAALTYYFI